MNDGSCPSGRRFSQLNIAKFLLKIIKTFHNAAVIILARYPCELAHQPGDICQARKTMEHDRDILGFAGY
jgi:hypothetical protein